MGTERALVYLFPDEEHNPLLGVLIAPRFVYVHMVSYAYVHIQNLLLLLLVPQRYAP